MGDRADGCECMPAAAKAAGMLGYVVCAACAARREMDAARERDVEIDGGPEHHEALRRALVTMRRLKGTPEADTDIYRIAELFQRTIPQAWQDGADGMAGCAVAVMEGMGRAASVEVGLRGTMTVAFAREHLPDDALVVDPAAAFRLERERDEALADLDEARARLAFVGRLNERGVNDLDELGRTVEALTDAPWVAVSDDAVWGIAVDDRVGDGSTVADLMSGRDARAIAALRNAAPKLIAAASENDRLRARVAELEHEVAAYRTAESDLLADADASQHWRTRAQRAEASNDELRNALRALETAYDKRCETDDTLRARLALAERVIAELPRDHYSDAYVEWCQSVAEWRDRGGEG